MNINIKHNAVLKQGLTFNQFAYLFSLAFCVSLEEFNDLLDKGLITSKDGKIVLSGMGHSVASAIMFKATDVQTDIERIHELMEKMKELFPTGRKPGTAMY